MNEMQPLAGHLRGFAQSFDMEGIQKVLENLSHAS